MSSLQSVDARTLRQSVTEAIRRAILQGDLLPGAQINQVQIAEQLGVSRGPVREALGQLEEEGLIRNVPYKGTFVTEITEEYIRELYDVRGLIETFAVRMAAEAATADDRHEIEQVMQAMERALNEEAITRFAELDVQFHFLIIRSAHHSILLQSWRSIEMGVRRCSMLRHRIYSNTAAVIARHREILTAMDAGDVETAAALLGNHITEARDRVLSSWAELLGRTQELRPAEAVAAGVGSDDDGSSIAEPV
jgi:DNA-binding GntR family transcriptional regulator